jgi:replicative DNA helicase
MSALAQSVLIRLLSDEDAMRYLSRVGVEPIEVVPEVALRGVVEFALDYYRTSRLAPTIAVLEEEFGDLLSDQEIDLNAQPEESAQWALSTLAQSYVRAQSVRLSVKMTTNVAEADGPDRVKVFQAAAAEIAAVAMSLQPRTTHVDMRETAAGMVSEYEARAAAGNQIRGMAFGLPVVDEYTAGVHRGELALLAAGTGYGKSWFMDLVALSEWERHRVAGLITLENTIASTEMRLACIALHLSYTELLRGTMSAADLAMLKEWVHDVFIPSDTPLHIFCPDGAMRTPQSVVAQAKAYEVDSLIIDQLTFMEAARVGKHDRRDTVLRTITHDLHVLIGDAELPCLLAHQVNREGMEYADKHGMFLPRHMAEGAEVERTVDMLFGLYASDDAAKAGRMTLFTAKNRRGPLQDFDLIWQPGSGSFAAREVIA